MATQKSKKIARRNQSLSGGGPEEILAFLMGMLVFPRIWSLSSPLAEHRSGIACFITHFATPLGEGINSVHHGAKPLLDHNRQTVCGGWWVSLPVTPTVVGPVP